MIKINDNWSIDTSGEGCTLSFAEKRIKNKDKENEAEFLFEENYYYGNVIQCLQAYLRKTQEDAKDVQDCIRITEESLETIKNLKL
jgi:hypothetical protein